MSYEVSPIEILPGIQSDTDFTPQSTPHFVESDKIRFVDGFPEKIGGWVRVDDLFESTIYGCPRMVFSYILSRNVNYMIGTHSNLYNLIGSTLINITPVKTTTDSLTDVLSTFYGTLGSDPIETTLGSDVVTVTDVGHKFVNGDVVTLSGSTDVNGILAASINQSHFVANITPNTYQFTVPDTATSSGSGGGSSVVRTSRIISVSQTNTFNNGANIVISGLSSTVGGIGSGDINGLRRVRSVTGSGYDILADAVATSSVSNTGGGIDIAEEIDPGTCDSSVGSGYGMGQYGVGLYGVSKQSSNPMPPSIWSADRFGNFLIMTRGNQEELYSWSGSTSALPEIVTNAPSSIDYVFVTNEIIVTLGASGIGNRLQWSDQGNLSVWSPTAENRAGQDDIEGASPFISHARLRGFNLLFTREQVYSFRYIDKPFVFETVQIDPSIGLIAQNARIVVNGICYWMGLDNFYMYRGGNVEIVPSNSISQSTIKKFVFENIEMSAETKIFCWYNELFNEIWWHYPSRGSFEPNKVATYNIRTGVWATHNLSRTAGEYPGVLDSVPYIANFSDTNTGLIYQHENGSNDDGEAMPWTLTTPYLNSGTKMAAIGGIFFDSIRNGDISVQLNTKTYPKSSAVTTSYTVADSVDKIAFKRRGRFWQYIVSGNELDQSWRSGLWYQYLKPSGRR